MSELIRIVSPQPSNELDVIKAADIVRSQGGLLQANAPLYLASDVRISTYGVQGFVLIDAKPENRRVSYYSNGFYNSGEPTTGHEEQDPDYKIEDPIGHARSFGTRHGFKALRYFVLPEAVTKLVSRDKFLGDPILRKCFEEDTTPEDYLECPVYPRDIFYGDDAIRGEESRLLRQSKIASFAGIISTIDTKCSIEAFRDRDGGWDEYFNGTDLSHQRAYISFHPWAVSHEVQTALDGSIGASLRNIDDLLSRFDVDGATKKEIDESR